MPNNFSVDGYRNFFAFAEWWTFKTKYTQWWTKSFESACLPLTADLGLSPGHVMRRLQYKGGTKLNYTLPVDAASSIGILIVVGTILPAASLSSEALLECRKMLKALEAYSNVREIVAIAPEGRELILEATPQGLFLLADLKHMFKKLGLNFARFQQKLQGAPAALSISEIIVALFRMRGSQGNQDPNSTFHRFLKRLCHSFSQSVEVGVEGHLLCECPDPVVHARVHPFMKRSRTGGNKVLQKSLIARWQSRGGGFASTKDNPNLATLGIVAPRSNLASRTTNELAVRALMKAAQCMEESASTSKVLNFCFDAAMVSEEHVLSVVFRSNGVQFAGATQLLPHGLCEEQATSALQSFSKAAKAQMESHGGPAKIPSGSFAWKEFRTKTKNTLMALVNCLQVILPPGFSLRNCCPEKSLVPRTKDAERFLLLPQEKQALGLSDWPDDAQLHFVYHFGQQTRWLDFIPSTNSMYKLCFAADEGSEGFIAWLHMNASSVWSVYWPDMMHKLARKASLSLTNSGASQWLKKTNKLYRMSLGPWGSGRFGKELLAARKHLLKALKDGSFDQDLLESWLRQVAKDQQVDPAEFSVSDLVLLLEKSGQWLKGTAHVRADERKDVRWFSFYDHTSSWNRRFHLEAFVMEYAWFCDGKSPWHLPDQSAANSEAYSSKLVAYNVLADDTNQDKMRSLLLVFRRMRAFAGEYDARLMDDRAVQQSSSGSLKYAISLANGKRLAKLLSKTIGECTTAAALAYIGGDGDGPECVDVIEWHSALLLYQLKAIFQVGTYHRSFPWRVVECLDPGAWSKVLLAMQEVWDFVVNVVDTLPAADPLYVQLAICRAQSFRDLMISAEYFNFDVKRMGTPCSRAFEENILAVCGLQQAGAPNSLLSSLPSELTFNQMRDCARRRSKHERCQPSSLHAVAWKAATKHPCGCANLDLDDNDWAVPLKQSEIKKSVHQNLRSTDKEMGINSEGLTKHKVVKHFTKPHVFTDRLELLDFIVKRFKEFPGDQEQKRGEILRARKAMWFSKLVPELWFLRRRSEDQSEVPENCLIVIGAGPYLVDCAGCSHVTNANYSLQATPPVKVLVDGLNTVEVAQCVPKSDGGHLRWSKGGPWIDLPTYTCDFGILSIGVQLLSQLCSALKIPSHQKLDHRHRVELFLKFMKKSDAYIAEILEQLVVPSRKKLADTEEESVMLHEEDPYNHLEGETSDEEVQETQNDLDEEMALKTAEHDKADTSKTDIEGPTANDVEMTE
ncbi:Uncharacterized protein SCF082_LOCUS52168, partial [Durusdinium trenchii]